MEITFKNIDQEILDAFSKTYNYQIQVRDAKGDLVDNPENVEDFTIRILTNFVNEIVQSSRVNTARENAVAQVSKTPINIIIKK